jgi:hypothetical protein
MPNNKFGQFVLALVLLFGDIGLVVHAFDTTDVSWWVKALAIVATACSGVAVGRPKIRLLGHGGYNTTDLTDYFIIGAVVPMLAPVPLRWHRGSIDTQSECIFNNACFIV